MLLVLPNSWNAKYFCFARQISLERANEYIRLLVNTHVYHKLPLSMIEGLAKDCLLNYLCYLFDDDNKLNFF